jgi:hypothetical protein
VTKKIAMFNMLAEQIETNTRTWPDKMEKFEEIVPAAKLQANVAIESLDGSDVFGVADMEMLDANLVVTPRGNPLNNFSQNVLDVCASQSL